ncbi:MAG TPA: fused MFS/spermidine synthase [Gemmatimonadales bacterium]|nr:fused MFS/spermidine synthase [Gemmatimonadales bacterium]
MGGRHGGSATRFAFALAVFLSAALLFVVEPMVGKMVLPILGGAPAVWTTCLLFFQVALLLGYLYAHWLSRRLAPNRSAWLHLTLLALAAATLPVALPAAEPTPEASPVRWLLLALVAAVGIPFVLVAATGPLLQRWFSELDHPDAADPYFLYAASNLGSFAGLLAYPFLLEPFVSLARQRVAWSGAYAGLILTIGVAALLLRRGATSPAQRGRSPTPEAEGAGVRPWRWLLLAAVPSSLLLAVTTHVSTDVAAVPLLWVLPLALYLLSFVVTFARRPLIPVGLAGRWLPLAVLLCVSGQLWATGGPIWLTLPLDYGLLFVAAVLCHGELARLRPAARRLTEFYLWVALGGALGGAFNAVVAPHVFTSVAEYPLAVAAVALLIRWPARTTGPGGITTFVVAVLALGVGLAYAGAWLDSPRVIARVPSQLVLLNGLALAAIIGALLLWRRRFDLLLAVGIPLILGVAWIAEVRRPGVLLAARDFFGVYRVQDTRQGFRVFFHGTTLHGLQPVAVRRRLWPTSYYHPEGPFGDVLGGVAPPRPGRRVGVVGLGAGGAAAYVGPDESWTFYEIDPLVGRIAQDTTYFTYLTEAASRPRVVLGDARLSLARDPAARFDVLVIDAFNSDAPPVHLLTREALAVYMGRLAPGGLLLVNVTNRHLDFDPVVDALAADAGLVARVRDHAVTPAEIRRGAYGSTWAVLARREEDLGGIAQDARWKPPRKGEGALWTDDFSNLVRRLR